MRFNPVFATIETRIGIDHFGRALAFGMKNVEVTVNVGLERDAYAIPVMKLAGRFDAHAATTRAAHEERVTKPDRLQGHIY